MVDQEPLQRWTFDRVSLLGDAAHPMLPRGSNGAGQAILDVAKLGDLLAMHEPLEALHLYETARLKRLRTSYGQIVPIHQMRSLSSYTSERMIGRLFESTTSWSRKSCSPCQTTTNA